MVIWHFPLICKIRESNQWLAGVEWCRNQNFHFQLLHLSILFDIEYCRVTVFGLSPLQWICREWGQKLGSDEVTACFGDERHTESSGLTSQGEGTPRSRTEMRQPLSVMQEPPSCFWASPLSLGGLCCYLFLSFVHPPPTLVNHPCLSSSTRLLNHAIWHFVSCCGPYRPVQGSHPHQRGSGC